MKYLSCFAYVSIVKAVLNHLKQEPSVLSSREETLEESWVNEMM